MPIDYLYVSMRGEEYYISDICKLDIPNRKLITSRKRTRNLFDLSTLWKKIVLESLDSMVLDDSTASTRGQTSNTYNRQQDDAVHTGRVETWRPPRSLSPDNEPIPRAWQTGHATWR